MADDKVVLTRYLRATPEEVFHACTTPEVLAQWLGPKDFEPCNVSADARVGGAFSFRMLSKERGPRSATGVYRIVDPPRRVQLTWTWTEHPEGEWPDGAVSLLTFDFEPDGKGTQLTLTHEGLPDQERADSHYSGWDEAVDKLERRFAERAAK